LARASRIPRAILLCVFGALCLCGFGIQEPQALPAGIEIKVEAEPRTAAVGDPIRIDINITMPKGYRASVPSVGTAVGDFTILGFYPGPSYPGASQLPVTEDQTRYQARLVVAVYKVGEFEFPPIRCTLRDPSGKEITAAGSSVKIQIQSILTEKDSTPKDLKKQAELQDPFPWAFWLALGLAVIVAVFLIRWWRLRQRRPLTVQPRQPELDPFAQAEAELQDLLSQGLLEKGLTKQFYVTLSEIIKNVLEAGYGIPTAEQTTSEISADLRKLQLEAKDLHRTESLLANSDLVKFAKYHPSKLENDAAVTEAFQILEASRNFKKPGHELHELHEK
jgi:hypothetical protein